MSDVPTSSDTPTDLNVGRDSKSQGSQRVPAFSVVIPAYNEEGAIDSTLDHLIEQLASRNCEYEIIVVDDGSNDLTREVLARRQDVCVFEHRRNRGYGAALKTGIRHAKHDLIVITDSDGTYPNERIPDLVALASDTDMVVGSRNGPEVEYPLIRKIPKWFLRRFAEWMARQEIPDLNSGLRVFRKDTAQRFLKILPNGFSFTTTITLAMLTNGYAVHYEPINYYARIGKSKIRPVKDTLNFVQLILRTVMYFAPLRVFLPVAGAFFVGFLASLFQDVFILQDLTERTFILFVTAVQLAMFALLADMIDKRTG
jgi:glycosyltransferase involved in cell wall biosynthesis